VTAVLRAVDHTESLRMMGVRMDLATAVPAVAQVVRHPTAVVRPGLAAAVCPTVTQMDCRTMAMVRRALAMVVPRAANARIPCIPMTPQATDGIDCYLTNHLTRITANRCLIIGISRITQPIRARLIEVLPNLFVILKHRSVAMRKGMCIPNSNTRNALIR
jgi:hypothetical protein